MQNPGSRQAQRISVRKLGMSSVQEQLANDLRKLIISGEIAPRTRLSEYALADSYGVSRTPVREALKQLQVERLVYVIPRVGTFVAQASRSELTELILVKEVLEGLAARQLAQTRPETGLAKLAANVAASEAAVERGDEARYAALVLEFHELLVNGSGNTKLAAHYRTLMNQLAYGRLILKTLSQPGRPRASVAEHRRVLELVELGKPDESEAAMRAHVASAHMALIEAIAARDDE